MKHIHHIIPKHMGGTNNPSNLIPLTVEEHAEAHRILYEKYGKWEDYIAWQGLSGRMGKEEVIRNAASLPNLGIRRSPKTEFKKGCKSVLSGKIYITNGNINKIHNPFFPIPDGWVRGLTKIGYTVGKNVGKYKRTKEIIEKQKENRKGKALGSKNAMANIENRKKISMSKIGRKRIYRENGSFYMSNPLR